MNTDDFEQQLQRQPLRRAPPEWRGEILGKCLKTEAGMLPASTVSPPASRWWRELLWPCPQAWVGVAAVWLLILGLHLMTGSEPRSQAQFTVISLSPETRAILEEQRRLFTELLPRPEPPPVGHREEPADRPRSERPEERRFSNGILLEPPCNHSWV